MATSRFKAITPKLRTEDLTSPPPSLAQPQLGAWDLDASWAEIAKSRPAPIPSPPGLGERALGYLKEGYATVKPFLPWTENPLPEPPSPKLGSTTDVGAQAPSASTESPVTLAPNLATTRDTLMAERDQLSELGAELQASQGQADYQQRMQDFQRQMSRHQQRIAAYKARVEQMPDVPDRSQPSESDLAQSGQPSTIGSTAPIGIRGELRKGFQGAVANVFERLGNVGKAGEAVVAGMTDPVTQAALREQPIASSIARYLPPGYKPQGPTIAQAVEANPTEPWPVQQINKRVTQQAKEHADWWRPPPDTTKPSFGQSVTRAVGGFPVQLAELGAYMATLGPVGGMMTQAMVDPAISGQGVWETVKSGAIGAATGKAFQLIGQLPKLAQIPGAFGIGAGSAYLHGGNEEEMAKSGITLAVIQALMGLRGAAPAGGRTTEGAPAREPIPTPQGALPGSPEPLALPPGPGGPKAIARGAIPQWEIAPKMGRRTVELLQKGMSPGQVVEALRAEGWPEIPGMPQAIAEAAKVMTPLPGYRGVVPGATVRSPFAPPEGQAPATSIPLAPPAVPGVPADLRTPVPAPVAAPPVQADPTQATNAISSLVNLGFSKKDATVLVTQVVSENPTADFETLIRTALGKTNAAKPAAPQSRPPVPPPLGVAPAVEPAAVEAAPVPEITPEPVVTPEIPPVAAQEALPAPITAEPVGEALPAQPGPTEPPAPVAVKPTTVTGLFGKIHEAAAPDGKVWRVQDVWADPGTLTMSHDTGFRANPKYDQDLQPRGRGGALNIAQVHRIRNQPNMVELGANPFLENGSPAGDPAGIILAGNGRNNGIEGMPPQNRQGIYHPYFTERAAEYGWDPAEVSARPLGTYYRMILDPIEDPIKLARTLNTGRTGAYSVVEQARLDADHISDSLLQDFKEGSEAETAKDVLIGQKDWVASALREFIPRNEWNTVFDPAGNIGDAGYNRLLGAIFQKAYDPQGPLTNLLLETREGSGMKNVLSAMLNASPAVLRADSRIARGEVTKIPGDQPGVFLPAQSVGPDVATAAEKLSALRNDPRVKANKVPGDTFTQYYEKNPEMYAGLTPRQVAFMREIETLGGSSKKLREFIRSQTDPVNKAPNELDTQSVLFMRAPREVLHQGFDEALIERVFEVFGRTSDPLDTSFIARDGGGVGGWLSRRNHGAMANEILNGRLEPSNQARNTLLDRTGFVRQETPWDYSSRSLPTEDQVRTMVRQSRTADLEHPMMLDAEDPREDYKLLATDMIHRPTVESVTAFYERVADTHRSLGLLDNGEGQASAVAYTLAGDRAFAGMDPHLIKSLGVNMYNRGLDYLAVKEGGIQNPTDAIMGLPPEQRRLARLNVDYQTATLGKPARVIASDQGIGMTKKIAVNEFVNIGGTNKRGVFVAGEKPRGGWGVAKIALFPNASKIFVRTVALDEDGKTYVTILEGTGDEWADPERGLRVTHKQVPDTTQTGTTVDITLGETGRKEPMTTTTFMENFLRYHSLPFPITLQVDGKTLQVESVRPTLNRIATLNISGATITVDASPELHTPEMFRVQILNGGMPQFTVDNYLGTENTALYPKHVVMDVLPTGTTEEPDYPFQLNREGLRDKADNTVRTYIRETLMADAARREVEGYRRAFQNAPKIMDTADLRLVDATQTLDPHQVAVLANDQAMSAFATASEQAYNKIHHILYGDRHDFPVHGRFFGLVIANKIFGANLRARDLYPDDLTVLQPFALAAHVKKLIDSGRITPETGVRQFANSVRTTLVHEVTHDVWRSDSSADFSRALTANYDRVSLYDTEIADRFLQNLEESYGQNGGQDVLEVLAIHHDGIQEALAGRDSIFSAITANLATDREAGRGPGGLGDGTKGWVRSLPDLLRSGGLSARRVASRTPVPRGGALRSEQSEALESALDRATFDPRLTPPGQIGHAGLIKNGRLTAYHVTQDPETATAQFKGGTRPDATRQGGDYGGGLYSSIIPEIWKGRGRQGVYEAIGHLTPPERARFIEAFRAENLHTFQPGYLTQSEIARVNRNLELFGQRGGEQFIATIAGQPYNMNPERALKAMGAGYKAPVTVEVEMQGKFLDWGAMSSDQTKSLQAAAHTWLTEEGYYDSHEKVTPKGLAVIRQFGNEKDLTNEYLRALGYDGALDPGGFTAYGQTVVWNLDAIRRFGDWHNSRPSPGVAGEGSYYPPKQGEVRLFSSDGVTFTANPELARESLNRRDPNARIRFVDVPAEIGTQTLAPLPPDLAAKARPLWSRTQDLSAIDPLAQLDPWGSKAEDTEPFTPQRDKMRALWRQFDEGSVPFEQHGPLAQAIRRETAMGITRLNPMIVGTTLTDGKSYVLIHEGASVKEPVRLTRFDKDGLSGHEVHQTPTLALVNAIRDGYLDLAPPNTMDRIMSSPGGQRSTDFQAVRDFQNELTFEHSPVWATFIKLPFEVQLRAVRDPEMLGAMRFGTIPEEIARYQPPEQLILTPPAMRPPVKPAAKQTELFPAAAVARRMPTERLRPKGPQVQGDLLANLRPPVTNAPDIFEPRPPQPKKTDPGVELGMSIGVPRMNREQRQALVKYLRSFFYGEGRSFAGKTPKEQAMTPGERMEKSRKRFYFARFSFEGFMQALGSPAALEARNAAINAQANEYGWNADMWRGMDALQKKYKNNLPEIEAALRDITKPVPGHIREAVDAILRIVHPDTGIIPMTTRDMNILGYTGAGGHEGGPRPFSPRRGDLMPRVYKDGYLEKVMTAGTKERAAAIAYVLQTGQVRPLDPADGERMASELLDKTLAKHVAERQSGGGARDSWAPGLTEAREIDLPDYIHNPFTAVAVRVGQASRKWAIRKQFGKGFTNVFGDEDAGTAGWLDQIQETHGEMARAAAEYLFDIAYGGHYDGGMTGKILGTIRNYESMTKLPLAILPNMGQNTLAGMEVGIRPWMQALAERTGVLGPGRRRLALQAAENGGILFRQSLRDMETQAGMMSSSPLSRLTGIVLRSWSWSESLVNRSIAPRAAIIALERLDAKLRRGGQLSNADKGVLRAIGMVPETVQQAGQITPAEIRNGAWRVMDNTQFLERPTAIPGLFDARGPLGELGPFLFQWKSFPVRLQRWMWHGALKEAARGNWAPIARFALIAPVVGELIALGRSILGNREREGMDEVASRFMENPGLDTSWDMAWHLLKNSTEAYGLGMTAQILDSFGYGEFAPIKALAGPGASQGYGLIAGLARGGQLAKAAYGGTQKDVDDLAKWYRDAYRTAKKEIPIIGRPLGSRPMSFTEAELLNKMASDEQKALSRMAGYRAKSLRSQGSDVDYYLKKELKEKEDINRKYQGVEGRMPVTGPSTQAIKENLERIDQEAGERARQHVPKRLRGAYPEKMSQVPQPPTNFIQMAAAAEQIAVQDHLAGLPPDRQRQMRAMMSFLHTQRSA